ncbi:DMT family transporter [Frigidibacter sp. RF13]|uniref:DMT family transporter n=1 Tax=Frigidibacter sp. RF13 TaxID=2997340 RepID=UPI00226E1B15|nr:DMT family transporter [Frigidibacter sp. RF13]MCY1125805.1 DMT family transporter [Frigidibacter sp. RF13]
MLQPILFALLGGTLVSVSRAINGRLSLATSAMSASFWNHLVGFLFLSAVALLWGGLMPGGWPDAPVTAWFGGTIGVLFVASGSWLVARIGATLTAMLVIAGQMVSGVALDLALGQSDGLLPKAAGVALILAGMVLARRSR